MAAEVWHYLHMAKLNDRHRQIPNGLRFFLPDLNYTAPPFASFDSICNAVHALMRANSGMADANGWPTDIERIRDWVDSYNAAICEANNWGEYFTHTDGGFRIDAPAQPTSWPLWAKALKLLRTDADKGVGDTLARTIGDETSEAFKGWYKSTFGRKCGCNGRRAEWNSRYSYK